VTLKNKANKTANVTHKMRAQMAVFGYARVSTDCQNSRDAELMAAGGTKVDGEIARSAMASKAIERLPAVNRR